MCTIKTGMSVDGGTKGPDVRSGKGGFIIFKDEEDSVCVDPSPRHQRATLPHGTGELSLASELFFSWYDPLLKVGRTRFLEQDDIWALPPSNHVSEWARQSAIPTGEGGGWVGDLVEKKMGAMDSKQRTRGNQEPKSASTLLMLWRSPLRGMTIRCGMLRLLAEVGSMSSPLCLNQIMRFLSNSDTLLSAAGSHTHLEGGVLVAAMFLASVWHSLALQHYIALCFASGAHAKALVQHRVFLSVLSLPTSTIQDLSTGQLTNLMAKDAGKVQDFMLFVHNIWSAPLSACWWLY